MRTKRQNNRADRQICPACGNNRRLTNHHVYPKRFFPNQFLMIKLCNQCHRELEELIPNRRKLIIREYRQLTEEFIQKKQSQLRLEPEEVENFILLT